ncbi:RNA polymerase II C-terminal domain phosphatase-like 4 [Syzygium oleosum]|uniref:RNA polymerase II C-terminal domain phosphatase-like 4 n=1 Tax=Syzygium oleosum TaxID=219896 RepID=UPI0011D1E64F|nr:RNA polymerase II C-terminal domain phosphatase-like 4 [Syzygium oleosum]
MANLRKSTPVSFAYPSPSPFRWVASDRAKRRKVECSHPVILERKCLLCGRAVFFDDDGDDRSLPFGFLHPSLRLSREYADRMREASTAAALGLQKLHLVLDLDHTLLHTVRLSNLTPEEVERLKPEAARNAEGGPAGGGGGDIFFVGSETGEGFITKLRPFVREFLREAHEMFQLMVYTMGGRVYSSRMTKLLDPDGEFFSDRVITREDCTLRGRKSLDVVLAKASNVLIVDDTETVWLDHADNLISIEPFWYFSHGSGKRGVRPSFGRNEDDDMLAMALRILKEIHRGYFDSKLGLKGGDVRDLVRRMPSLVCHTSGDQAPPGDA